MENLENNKRFGKSWGKLIKKGEHHFKKSKLVITAEESFHTKIFIIILVEKDFKSQLYEIKKCFKVNIFGNI